MVEDGFAQDVAKVLQGTHNIRILTIPAREYDLINRILADGRRFEDAEPGGVIVQRTLWFDGAYSVEVSLTNTYVENDPPALSFHLLYTDESDEIEDMFLEGVSCEERIPDHISFQEEGEDGKLLTLRIERGK